MSGPERPIEFSSSVTAIKRWDFRTGEDSECEANRSPRIEAHRHRAGMAVEPLALAEHDCGRPERAQLIGTAFEDRRALHEVEHAEPGREARRARGGQHVVRATDIIADRLGRVGTEENGAGVAYPAGQTLGV